MSALALFSSEWWAKAHRLLANCRAQVDVPDISVQYRASDADVEWVEVVVDGRVGQWRSGTIDRPDLIVHLPGDTAWSALAGDRSGTEILNEIEVSTPNHPTPGPPAPIDVAEPATALPALPGATVSVQYEFAKGPWGAVSFGLSFRDGRIDRAILGKLDDPDVVATGSFLQSARVRRGDLTAFDVMFAGGTIHGSEGALALLGGIIVRPELQALQRDLGPSGIVLGTLGEVHAAPGYREALENLVAVTDPSSVVRGAV